MKFVIKSAFLLAVSAVLMFFNTPFTSADLPDDYLNAARKLCQMQDGGKRSDMDCLKESNKQYPRRYDGKNVSLSCRLQSDHTVCSIFQSLTRGRPFSSCIVRNIATEIGENGQRREVNNFVLHVQVCYNKSSYVDYN